jgi:hypothetical protein
MKLIAGMMHRARQCSRVRVDGPGVKPVCRLRALPDA